ncbi:PIG-L deacetylase family protein [Rhizobium mongolense]|uniref:LmbE family N-acetylglucosaminyl deacetylase n=1 Tax=Rhizobium mongolense TaxID=57676 RepID=A0A7W6WHD9_9HYPH|nr:PIG-L family deacetylase [Rhizobium mongolense]MBB4277714.1 LmbE family N-acetylglucosaminyl deacetylase [Rhizobium mongolense]
MGKAPACHLFLSPHLDDAPFSCAGLIRKLTSGGDEVIISTLITADATGALTPLASRFHGVWNRGDRPYAIRREEDLRVADFLGARCRHEGFLDAIYRKDDIAEPIYSDIPELFAGLKPADQKHVEAAAARLGQIISEERPDIVYAPIGIGRHADHLMVVAAAKDVCLGRLPLRLYEEFPYLLGEFPAEHPITVELGLELSGWQGAVPEFIDVELAVRIEAARLYPSQISEIFGNNAGLVETMQRHAERYEARSGSERLWTPEAPSSP